MARSESNSTSPFRHTSTTPSSPSHLRSVSAIDTSYNGSQGLIESDSIAHSRDTYDGNALLPSPSKALLPGRQALSARLLSTISSAQSPAALNRSRSVLHSRAKSTLAQYVPKLSSAAAASGEDSDRVSQTSYSSSSNQLLNSLFSGESAPVRIGVASSPEKEEPEPFMPEYKTVFTERPMSRRTDSSRSCNDGSRKTSWFTRKFNSTTAPPPAPVPKFSANDELLTLDINTTLFPYGPADPHDPHAFNDLLLNATRLLERMQNAYREKSQYLATIQPEIDAQKEEVEEAETRSRHLKMQLEDMCTKAAEQDRTMREMATQLAEEKLKLQEEKDRAAKSLRMISQSHQDVETRVPAERRYRKRSSAGSTSDSGFESDYAESMHSGGVDNPMGPSLRFPQSGIQHWQQGLSVMASEPRPILSRQATIRSTASSMSANSNHRTGRDAAARITVDQLRQENHELSQQLAEVQLALQGCIDLVGDAAI